MLTAVGLRDLQLRPISLAVLSLLGNAIDEAVAILQKYGGSLWVADPAYTFTGSDGTGAAGDGSDAGYVRDLCATYGAELITNGDFSQGSTGWSTIGSGGTLTPVAGSLQITGGTSPGIRQTILTAGKTYQITYWTRRISGTANAFVGAGGVTMFPDPAGQLFTRAFTATGPQVDFGISGDASSTVWEFDNISVREIIGRPLFQSTTGFKPKLRRVPKRLGAELVANGDFAANISGWGIGAGLSAAWSSGAATVSRNGGIAGLAFWQVIPAVIGKYYQIGFSNTGASAARNYVGTAAVGSMVEGIGAFSTITQATSSSIGINYWPTTDGTSITLDNISVREVLEWGWAWVFDGVDDRLATVSLPTADAETLMVAGQFTNTTAVSQGLISKRNGNFGLMVRREGTLNTTGYAMTGSTIESAVLDNSTYATTKRVYTVAAASGNKRYRRDGAQVNTTTGAYTSNASILSIGAEISSSYAACNVFAAAYIPGTPPDAEMLIVEKAMAELGGITL